MCSNNPLRLCIASFRQPKGHVQLGWEWAPAQLFLTCRLLLPEPGLPSGLMVLSHSLIKKHLEAARTPAAQLGSLTRASQQALKYPRVWDLFRISAFWGSVTHTGPLWHRRGCPLPHAGWGPACPGRGAGCRWVQLDVAGSGSISRLSANPSPLISAVQIHAEERSCPAVPSGTLSTRGDRVWSQAPLAPF